ncbi:MAG: hypothetical protein WDM78_11520 [Puia sp.]
MKTFKLILAFLIAALVATSCSKSNLKQPTVQQYFAIKSTADALSIIDNVKVNDTTVLWAAGSHFPLPAGQVEIVAAPNALGQIQSVISVYLQFVQGETIVFTDTYGKVRYTTFDYSSNTGYVSMNFALGYGTQQATIEVFHSYINYTITPDLSAGSGEPGYKDPSSPNTNY